MSRHPLLRFITVLPLLVLGTACGRDARGEAGSNRARTGGGGGPGGGGPGGGGPPQNPGPLLAAPNVPRSDLPALARSQVRAIREEARRAATTAPTGVVRAHWQDIADRADEILEPRRGR